MAALLWASLFYFCVLCAYYVIRPIRDDMGVAGGVDNLPWLFTGTLIGMALVNPPYAALVSKLPRLKFITYTYRFFEANLLIFFALLLVTGAAQQIWIGRVFFIWTSVFNLFVVSVFWAFLVDVFTREQGTRLFGFIAAGATVGAMSGSAITAVARVGARRDAAAAGVGGAAGGRRLRDAQAVGHRHGAEDQDRRHAPRRPRRSAAA